MRKNILRTVALLVSLMMLAGIMAGCGGSKQAEQPKAAETKTEASKAEEKKDDGQKTASGLDISKKVELQFWMLGPAPKDLPLIQDEVNKMAEKDLNCTIKFNFTTWTDWAQKYKLLLTSGQPIDLIFTAEWTSYQMYARSGAFLPLDDIVPKAAPELWKFIPQDYWNAVKVAGKIYTMPATYKEYVNDGFEYRKDLAKKYGIPEVNSLETMEAYLDAIKKNEPGMMCIAEGVAADNFSAIYSMTSQLLHTWTDRGMPFYGLVAENATPGKLEQYWGTEAHRKDLLLYKKWADKGYWSRSILSTKEDAVALFRNGKLAARMAGINVTKFADDVTNIKTSHPDWEIGWFPFSDVSRVVHPVHPNHNGFAVPKSSQNPERAVAFWEKMVLDKRYNLLTQYGIEGKHYTVENGYYKMLGDQSTNGFPREAMQSWAWRNPNYMLFTPAHDLVKEYFAKFDKYATPDVFNGFAEDYTVYQTERTALQQVMAKYLQPLQAGLVADVDKGLKEFMENAKKAGLEKIQAEYMKQYKAYCEEMGIK